MNIEHEAEHVLEEKEDVEAMDAGIKLDSDDADDSSDEGKGEPSDRPCSKESGDLPRVCGF